MTLEFGKEQLERSADRGPDREPVDVLITIPHLGPGGAQRVAALLANHWHDYGINVAVLTLFERPDAHTLRPGIHREDFALASRQTQRQSVLETRYLKLEQTLERDRTHGPAWRRPLSAIWVSSLRSTRAARGTILLRIGAARRLRNSPRVKWLRSRFIALRPKAVIAFLTATNIQTLEAARGLGFKTLISERNDPSLQQLKPPWQRLRRLVYPSADLVTANSAGALREMRDYVPEQKLQQVANPVIVPAPISPLEDRLPRIVYVGRLVEQKAPGTLLEAFGRIAPYWPEWHLDIIGEGPLRPSLESQVDNLGITKQCRFFGHLNDVYPILQQGSVFVLPSRFEGMPNAMLEAMACGLAVIVSNASPGPLELVRTEETGLTFKVDDVEDLAGCLSRLLSNAALRMRLARCGQAAASKMSLPAVAARWEELLHSVGVAFETGLERRVSR